MKNNEYFNWLMTRSFKGLLYRKFFLYPKIKKHMKFPAADIGCGIGDFLQFCGTNITGFDINENCINFCRNKNLNAFLMNFDKIPAEDSNFNSVILDNVLEHILDPIPLLNDCNRVLDDDGIMIVGVPGEKGYLADPDHKTNYLDQDLIKIVEKVGFRFNKLFYAPFRSDYINKNFPQYCRYFIFVKKRN